jgi:energy-coupling factor transporter ATP-binding protein EcfA2
MKINKVKLYNFSSYEGNNEFDFEITDAEKNIVLIGGKNGAGKTSLFTAIKVALYGPLAYGYVGVNSHYISKIKDLINSKAFQQEIVESEVQITLQLKIERDIRNYVITRKWDYTNQRLTEEYTVERDGKQLNDQELSYFENYLRSIIPPDLFEFFLFDGEEVGNIFSTSAYNTYVRNAVFTMCGMDVFEIIRKFTRGYVTRNNSIDDDEAYDTYESAKQQMELLETEKENLESEVSNLTKELEDIEVQLTELTTAFKNAGGISRKEKKQLEDEFNQAEKVKTETLTNIKLFVEGLMPFYILRDFANPIMSQLDFEEKGEIFYYVQSKLNRDAISELLKGDVSDSKVDQLMDHLLDTFRPKGFRDDMEMMYLKVVEFDNITEFSAYVARIYEEAAKDFHADEHKNGSVLSYMKEQFYSANNSVNDILKVYFPEQFGERHFLAYPIGHFFVAVTNMWDSENGGIRIENMNDIAECLYSGALYEKKVGSLITTFNQTKNYFSRATKLKGDSETDGVIDLLKKLKKQMSKLNKGKIEYIEQLAKLSYFNVELGEIDELIEALEALNTITKIFYEDFENESNNFKHFYEKLKDFVETQILPTADAESEFQDILLRLLVRLEEVEKIETTSTFDCLKDTMAYYLKQESQKGESANWIVRDFQQIDGDILKSSTQDPDIIYHFACVSDSDMNVKREDQFPWPLTIEFFERAYEPLDWKYQVYVKSRKEFKHFKRYALIYGLEFNRCKFKLSFIKNDDDKENELYYILKLLGVKTEKNIHDTTEVHEKQNITFDLGKNTNNFVDLDGFRRRICGYRFALESLIENGTKYQDRFLQTKYLEIILANNVRRKLEGQIATEAIMNEALDDSAERWRRYFRFLNESEITDIKSNAKNAIIHQALQDGKIKQFPKVTDIDSEMMRKKEEFIYLHLENENQENVLLGKFNDLTMAEKKQFLPDNLKNASYDKEANIWCQWCAVREKCLENYKSLVEI